MEKVKEQVQRYGLAELIGTAAAYGGFFLTKELSEDNVILSAYVASIAEGVGFYGTMIKREIKNDRNVAREAGEKYNLVSALKTAGKLVSEFGPAEALDSLVTRPVAIGGGSELLGDEIGVGAGKIAADIIFYLVAISSYEGRKGLANRFRKQDN